MAGEKETDTDPAKDLIIDHEKSDPQKFELIGMIMRRMVDKAFQAAKENKQSA